MKLTNFERIKAMSVSEMAEHNVRECQTVIDDWCEGSDDGEVYCPYVNDEYMTSDGRTFPDKADAVAHETKWLMSFVR